MKAIKITQQIKTLNPNFGGAVGSIYSGSVPKTFIREADGMTRAESGYDTKKDLQVVDGWKGIVNPTIGENQRRGQLIELNGKFTYEVIDLTAEQIAAKGFISMPKSDFKLALNRNHGITDAGVDTLFAGLIAQGQIPLVDIEEMRIRWTQPSTFNNQTPQLYQFAGAMGITEADIKQIFKDYADV